MLRGAPAAASRASPLGGVVPSVRQAGARRQAVVTQAQQQQQQQEAAQQTELPLAGPEPRRFTVAEGQLKNIASAAFPALMRLGSGAFVSGYKSSLVPEQPGQYAVISFLGRSIREDSAVGGFPRPAQPLVLYEFEGCPFCRKVREAVSILDLDVVFYPTPKDGPTWRPEAIARGGKRQFPYMIDPNTGKEMYESDAIIEYMFKSYGNGEVPLGLRLGPLTVISCGLAMLPRMAKGSAYKKGSKLPKEPLVYWGYEASPFCKVVREKMCELEVPHLYRSCARGSPKRQSLFERRGTFQVPYIEDPNTGVAMFESSAIVEYLEKTYGSSGSATLAVRGKATPRRLAAVPVTGATGVAAGGGPATAAKGQMVVSTNPLAYRDLSMLVIPIQAGTRMDGCRNTQLPMYTPADVKRAIFEDPTGSSQTLGSVVRQCSYGRSKVTQRSARVADLVELPCSGTSRGVAWSMSTCEQADLDGAASAAEDALRAKGVDVDSYVHRVFLMPPGACQMVGMAQVGCDRKAGCRAWIGGYHWISAQAIMHEVSHHMNLDHAGAWRDGLFQEYGDDTCGMAYCCAYRCFNTPHAWQLGWISVQQVDGASLAPGQTVTATLASQSVGRAQGGGLRRGVRIVPTWAPAVDPLFLGYRTRHGGDATLPDGAANKLSVYTAAIKGADDARMTTWEGALAAGESWTHPTAGLVVRFRSVVNGTTAVVSVCRKGGVETLQSCQANRDMDCNGLAGVNDRACAAIFKRRRKKKKAAPEPVLAARRALAEPHAAR
ncbi:hypothetical protein C2E20_0521 [Micractinium conductrix]|uniref:GST N-terminal domain-containing protein n=1 Tax=Micractinium conductrix TaxID=554055 RepID=A0A2P6VSK1_9CHLO|nr:hypothetical protein C2E20_0521 [Micractinium conductrix]|eukprot:PSC77062.1 hypothetical protein C2E20_0521 [Micractinium conductrix]